MANLHVTINQSGGIKMILILRKVHFCNKWGCTEKNSFFFKQQITGMFLQRIILVKNRYLP